MNPVVISYWDGYCVSIWQWFSLCLHLDFVKLDMMIDIYKLISFNLGMRIVNGFYSLLSTENTLSFG